MGEKSRNTSISVTRRQLNEALRISEKAMTSWILQETMPTYMYTRVRDARELISRVRNGAPIIETEQQ